MTDLISREAALKILNDAYNSCSVSKNPFLTIVDCSKIKETLVECIREIKAAPAVDAVEVVRCKDCRYYMEYRERTETADGDCRCKMFDDADHLLCLPVHYDDYCSRGRKKR